MMTPAEYQQLIQNREENEYKNAIEDVRAMLATLHGQRFLKYLFRTLNVGKMPEQGLDGMMLGEALGFHRAGASIFELVSIANFEMAGRLLGQKEKENYELEIMARQETVERDAE